MSALTFTTPFVTTGVNDWRHGYTCIKNPTGPMAAAHRVLMEKAESLCGGFVTVKLDSPHRPRSTGPRSQNHRLNGFVSQFCNATGNDFEDIKLFVKRRAMRRGLPPKNAGGKVIYSKVDGEPLPISEADMSVEQCGWVISEIEQLSAEEGVTLVESD